MYSNPVKEKAWKIFAKYIKLRDSYLTTGASDMCACISCGEYGKTKNFDAGHFVSGRNGAVLFHEKLVHAQCQYCNRTLGGNYKAYEYVLNIKYGEEEVQRLLALKHRIKKVNYLEVIEKYQNKINALTNN